MKGTMKVILLKDVEGLGRSGAVKEVKEGYARNYLLPRGLAMEATEGNVRTLEGQKKAVADRTRREKEEAEQFAARLSQMVLEVRAKGGEGGRLFGSVTAQDIADALVANGFQVTKKQVELDEPIKTAGFFKVPVRISQGVVARVDVNVVPFDPAPHDGARGRPGRGTT